jgi:phosphoglycolate phosphatase-like HAD superfamily hydrolase
MKFVGLANYFDEIVGFPIEIEKNKHHNKKKMLLRLMEKHKLEQRQTCYIGDSASDIKSGQEAGVFTIGIANNYANGAKLIEQGCDLLATSMAAYAEILKWLTSLRKTESVKQAF